MWRNHTPIPLAVKTQLIRRLARALQAATDPQRQSSVHNPQIRFRLDSRLILLGWNAARSYFVKVDEMNIPDD